MRVLAAVVFLVLFAVPGVARAQPVTVSEDAQRLVLRSPSVEVRVTKAPWRLELAEPGGRVLAREADPALPDPPANADATLYRDLQDGVDLAYPGLDRVSYKPLAYLRAGAWRHVTAVRSVRVRGALARLGVQTSDGDTAVVELRLHDDGAVQLVFRPPAGTEAVAEAFERDPLARYVGGGQRLGAVDQTGRSVPLWISHGIGSDRYAHTNEIAWPFLMSTGGWGLWARSHARGEMNVGVPGERPDALNVVIEDDALDLMLFPGAPADVLRSFTARAGRPEREVPQWAFKPMFWQDEDIDQEAILGQADRLTAAGIPVGAMWIDNPWEARHGDFAPSPERFPQFDAMVGDLHGRGIKVMAWSSPFVPADAPDRVRGAENGDLDQTYMPPRKIEAHQDLTDPAAAERMTVKAAALLARGVDGFKLDRGEEDLGDDSVWANGRPNRSNHNEYVVRYQAALGEACRRARPSCFLIARGGATGTPRYAANWAGDTPSGPGALGIEMALRSLLTLSLSGQPVSGSDVGGYVGTRQESEPGSPEECLGVPTKGLYLRWAQLGALSPIMETDLDPTAKFCGDAEVVRVFRRYARLKVRLAPFTARYAREARATGMPIVRPMLLAYPGDAVASRLDDQYLFGPDLLVAPITAAPTDTGPDSRSVWIPPGTWVDAWSGERVVGPATRPVTAPLDRLPLWVRSGGDVALDLVKGL